MNQNYQIGYNRGTELIQRKDEVGGARSVFVKLRGIKNDLIYPTFGGRIMNPFKGAAKLFAGDLCEYRTDAKGTHPEIYILKTYKVKDQVTTAAKINIVKNGGYAHTPFVGDKLGVAPAKLGGAVTTPVTLIGVVDKGDYWEVTADKTVTISPNAILVEAGEDNNMVVKNINAVIDADVDFFDAPADVKNDEDFYNARYMYTPALGGLMYINKMSAMPKCVLDLNKANVNGWFRIDYLK